MVPSIKCLPHKHDHLSSEALGPCEKPGMVECVCYPNTVEGQRRVDP